MTLLWMIRKLEMISDLLQEISFIVISWNLESNSTWREKKHFLYSAEVYGRLQKHSYIIWCNIGENIYDYSNVDGERELSDAWSDFSRLVWLNKRSSDGCAWIGEETYFEINVLKIRQCLIRDREVYSWSIETSDKAKMNYREIKAQKDQKITCNLLHWIWWWRIQAYYEKLLAKL